MASCFVLAQTDYSHTSSLSGLQTSWPTAMSLPHHLSARLKKNPALSNKGQRAR